MVIVADLVLVDSDPHVFGVKEATRWVIIYMAAVVLFGIGLIFLARRAIRRAVLRRLPD